MPKNYEIPSNYICYFTHKIMIDPVVAADGHTYEREGIVQWMEKHDTSPDSKKGKFKHNELTENEDKRIEILGFLKEHPELYKDEVYLPKSWVDECITAIKKNTKEERESLQIEEVERCLARDERLLTVQLEGDFTALHLACEFSSPKLVDTILKILGEERVKLITSSGVGGFKTVHLNVLLEIALDSGNYPKCELLLQLGAEVEQPELTTNNTLLHRMVICNNQEAVSWLLERDALLESCNAEGNTPLLLSVLGGHLDLTKFLLEKKANPAVKNVQQQSSLYLAVNAGDNEYTNLFLSKHDNPSFICEGEESSVLHVAVQNGNMEILEILLETEAATLINLQNGSAGDTPLHLAVRGGSKDIISLLLAKGADHRIKNKQNQTPRELAETQKETSVLANLIVKTVQKLKKARSDKQSHEIAELKTIVQEMQAQINLLKVMLSSKPPEIASVNALEIEPNLVALGTDESAFKFNNVEAESLIFDKLEDAMNLSSQAEIKAHEEERRIPSISLKSQEFQKQLEKKVAGESRDSITSSITLNDSRSTVRHSVVPPPPPISRDLPVQATSSGFLGFSSSSSSYSPRNQQPVFIHTGLAATPNVNPKEVEEFLRLVAAGEQDKAEAMLKSNPALALVPGDVTDLSNRRFNGITAFQYAVWALDWHMWTMIRKYLSPEETQLQAQGFEKGSWVREHEVNAKHVLDNLTKAYDETFRLLQESPNKANDAWIKQVGQEQSMLPAHVVNEYCHITSPFTDSLSQPNGRTRSTIDGIDWFTVLKRGTIALCRDTKKIVEARTAVSLSGVDPNRNKQGRITYGLNDRENVVKMTKARMEQYNALMKELQVGNVQRNTVSAR